LRKKQAARSFMRATAQPGGVGNREITWRQNTLELDAK